MSLVTALSGVFLRRRSLRDRAGGDGKTTKILHRKEYETQCITVGVRLTNRLEIVNWIALGDESRIRRVRFARLPRPAAMRFVFRLVLAASFWRRTGRAWHGLVAWPGPVAGVCARAEEFCTVHKFSQTEIVCVAARCTARRDWRLGEGLYWRRHGGADRGRVSCARSAGCAMLRGEIRVAIVYGRL